MANSFWKSWAMYILIFIFAFFTGWWSYMNLFLKSDNSFYSSYANLYGIIALWAGISGLVISSHWGGVKSVMGRAILMFSLGLFAQEFGQLAYSYYIYILHIDIPYPSIGDIGFFGTIPFYIYAAMLVAKAAGVKVSLRSLKNKFLAVIIPLVIFLISYFFILRDTPFDLKNPLETFLNFGYPLGQAIYISIALLTYSLTRGILGGVMKSKIIFIILAFCMQFLSDFMYIYFKNQYIPGGIIDFMYSIAYFMMGLALFELQSVIYKLRKQ